MQLEISKAIVGEMELIFNEIKTKKTCSEETLVRCPLLHVASEEVLANLITNELQSAGVEVAVRIMFEGVHILKIRLNFMRIILV